MVVVCPKCKTRLRVDEAKLLPQGTRFKCPKCSTVLMIKKPVSGERKALDNRKILVAHSKASIVEDVSALLSARGYVVLTSGDGVDAMIKALKEGPFVCILEVALPKIYGFEVCKRLRSRPETKDMKFVLVPSTYDRTRYRREPVSLYGADEYIEEHELPAKLIDAITRLKGEPVSVREGAPNYGMTAAAEKTTEALVKETVFQTLPQPPETVKSSDEFTEKAKRLSRTIVNDIYLYNSSKVDEAVRRGDFYAVFAGELKEGQKLYENRIPQETRNKGDFFKEAIDNFISSRKKGLS